MVRTLECPNCGGTVELKYERTINAVCIQCLSVLDATNPSLQILQKFEGAKRYQPKIPLGTRGKLQGGQYEAIGFQIRQIEVDGVTYEWSEYLLHNPYKGYRYLTEYNGHWNDIRTLRALPVASSKGSKPSVIYGGKTYTHFQSASAVTAFVMGEFPWQVRVGDSVDIKDYVAAPESISSEETEGEVVWSIGRYTNGAEIWKAFGLKDSPPAAIGIYSNQPSPYTGRIASSWMTFTLLSLLLLLTVIGVAIVSPRDQAFRQTYTFSTGNTEPSFVTPVFALKGAQASLQVQLKTDLSNDWAYFGLALINDDTGTAYDFGKQVSFYAGSDSDGAWTEGNRSGSVSIPAVPAGRYYLRVEPEMEKDGRPRRMRYELTLQHGAPSYFWFVLGFLGLLIPPVVTSIRAFSFENRRWAESDYGALVQSSSGEDD
ncbi:MAG TPA: DUF4178 domain-containing protein [Bryobacteraceae bacterium]|nr:DUF4178 domain-containing protein [Bryobacteraceae bacterium]